MFIDSSNIPFLTRTGIQRLSSVPPRLELSEGPCFVYLGPTLPCDEAKALMPDARFLPPVAGGDLLALSRLKPSTVVLIDGVFERQPAVWHKEILFLLSRGVRVIGASSMGALRACETEDFGMIGSGAVFQAYREGWIEGDDEVAVLHGDARSSYASRSVPMVNVRCELGFAVEQGVLSLQEALEILSQLRTPYFDRTIEIYKRARERYSVIEPQDLKKRDAVELLRALAQAPRTRKKDDEIDRAGARTFVVTTNLIALQRDMHCEPLRTDFEGLPGDERQAREERRYPIEVRRKLRMLARMIWAFDQLGLEEPDRTVFQGEKQFLDRLDGLIGAYKGRLDEACQRFGFTPSRQSRFSALCLRNELASLPVAWRLTDRFYFKDAKDLLEGRC